ncbi:GDSL-type esterase/lipase family protein [Domibacillus sp. PGB-M46]|uniref:GDSL-type esterase/lipase family protein n=1 Tax=Domibacillus sp. PGB-M46 TaxID=2910255 RepID=UPI001F580E7B|nr:GDSL-type esterase/lipase family protein [Domibacillus sp. PGB-M46]MCI2253356.1 GDSL-type esterase/lipase family protein [Domibacillus sp. PGB-M46]
MKVIATILSVVAVCVAGFAIWIYYPQYQIEQLKEGPQTLASEQKKTYIDYFRESDKQVLRHLAIGDSIITGFGAPPKENLVKSFSESLESSIQKEVEFQNEGINEITSTELNRLVQGGEFDDQIKKADIVTINIGGNDILQLGFQKGFYEAVQSVDSLQKTFNANLTDIMERVHTLNPEATVLLLELYNPLDKEFELYSMADRLLPRWNLQFYELAAKHDYAVVVDTTEVINSETPQNVSDDGIHPNEFGYHAIADQMLFQLQQEVR